MQIIQVTTSLLLTALPPPSMSDVHLVVLRDLDVAHRMTKLHMHESLTITSCDIFTAENLQFFVER